MDKKTRMDKRADKCSVHHKDSQIPEMEMNRKYGGRWTKRVTMAITDVKGPSKRMFIKQRDNTMKFTESLLLDSLDRSEGIYLG